LDYEVGEDFALRMDSKDQLAGYKNRFYSLGDSIYMDGNSLGLMSVDSERSLIRVMNEWKTQGIKGWGGASMPWIDYPETLGNLMAPFVGGRDGEVVVTGGTTINLHALVSTFYEPEKRRTKIIADELNFPSDLYALAAQVRLKGGDPEEDLVLVKSRDGLTVSEDDIISYMDNDVSLVVLPSVYYRSGQLLDMEKLTREAHERGIVIGFDCAHSVGVVPHRFSEWGTDFAFWCNYKYMNGGPGSVGGLYVNKRHHGEMPGLAGWFGNKRSTMFDMRKEFDPAQTATAWEIGTINMLSAAPIEGSIYMMREAGIENIRDKSLKITGYLMYLIDETLSDKPYSFGIATPREPQRRGGHVGVYHEEAWRINQALIKRGVIPDFRPPNIIRLAPIPLYTSYHDVWKVAEHLREVIDSGEYLKYSTDRSTVT
jgi:kynureninase